MDNISREAIREMNNAVSCLTGELRGVLDTATFSVKIGKDTFTVTVERTTP